MSLNLDGRLVARSMTLEDYQRMHSGQIGYIENVRVIYDDKRTT